MKKTPPLVVLGVLAILYFLHIDFGMGHNPTLVLGLPVALWYHVAYCGAVVLVMWWLTRTAWPLDGDGDAP